MARPRGRTKTARLTINLDQDAYNALIALADREDVPVAQLARRAVSDFLGREDNISPDQAQLPLVRTRRDG